MEDPSIINYCRMCLAILIHPKNLRDDEHEKLLEILNSILGFEIEDEVFEICGICEKRLKSVIQIKYMCLKSIQDFANRQYKEVVEIKQEPEVDSDNCDESKQFVLDEHVGDLEHNADDYSGHAFEFSSPQSSISQRRCREKNKIADPLARQFVRKGLKQFPKSDVLQAISDRWKSRNSIRHRTCLHCDYVGKSVKGLSCHMGTMHREFSKYWCFQCNLQTDNLRTHKRTKKCFHFFCIFCKKYACLMKQSKDHLRSHCYEILRSFDISHRTLAADLSDNDNSSEDKPTAANIHILVDRCSPSAQFPKENVLRAIEECKVPRLNDKYKTCLVCQYVGASPRNLSIHMSHKHRELVDFWCFNCNLQTANLKQHKKTSKCSFSTCKFCRKRSISLQNAINHLKSHCRNEIPKSNRNYKANVAKKSMVETLSDKQEKSVDLEVELSVSEDDSQEIKNIRSKQFAKRDVLQAIVECKISKAASKHMKCIHCAYVGQSPRNLSRHMSAKHKDFAKSWCFQCNVQTEDLSKHKQIIQCFPFTCKFCKRHSLRVLSAVRHLRTHCYDINSSDESDQEILSGKYKSSDNAEFENVSTNNVSSFKHIFYSKLCNICGKDFKNSSNLKRHLLTHKEVSSDGRKRDGKSRFLCSVCAKPFDHYSQCRRHENIHDGGPQKCPVCGVTCNRPERLKIHMRRHTGENENVCEQCGISFHIKSLLLKHLKSHSDEKLLQCSFCDKHFKLREEVTVHERSHKGIHPYACTLCPYSCTSTKELTQHMKRHPEDTPQANTPFHCQLCTKKFSTNAMLVSHSRNQHTNILNYPFKKNMEVDS